MTVKLVGSTSGSVSLQAPASTTGGAHRIITLPDRNQVGLGSVLQVKQTVKTDTASTSSTSFADVFTVSITPTAATSKFLLTGDLKIGYSSYSASVMWKFVRDSTDLFIGDADGNRTRCTWGIEDTSDSSNDARFHVASTHGTFLDSPNTTSAITYRVQWSAQQNTGYLNRTGDDTNGLAYPRAASSLTVMEIAA
jgi:hypothetical protein|tara:strand:+ start:844 stop:1428 length:585 start_codon:yes stop_codon:yes gene_type:complete